MDVAVGGVEVGVHGTLNVVKEDVRPSVAGKTKSPGSDTFVHAGFVQLWLEATTSAPVRSIDSEGPFRRLGHNEESNSLSDSAEEGAQRVQKVTA